MRMKFESYEELVKWQKSLNERIVKTPFDEKNLTTDWVENELLETSISNEWADKFVGFIDDCATFVECIGNAMEIYCESVATFSIITQKLDAIFQQEHNKHFLILERELDPHTHKYTFYSAQS